MTTTLDYRTATVPKRLPSISRETEVIIKLAHGYTAANVTAAKFALRSAIDGELAFDVLTDSSRPDQFDIATDNEVTFTLIPTDTEYIATGDWEIGVTVEASGDAEKPLASIVRIVGAAPDVGGANLKANDKSVLEAQIAAFEADMSSLEATLKAYVNSQVAGIVSGVTADSEVINSRDALDGDTQAILTDVLQIMEQGVVYAEAHGVSAAGTATANTAALNDAITAANGKPVLLPGGVILVERESGGGGVAEPTGQFILMGNGETTLKMADNQPFSTEFFRLGSAVDYAVISGIRFDGNRRGNEVYLGDWATATSYVAYDSVTHNSVKYRCIVAHTSASANEPDVGENEATYWNTGGNNGNELSHAVYIRGAKNVTVTKCQFDKMAGDGVAIGGDDEVADEIAKNIKVTHCDFLECGRDGVSIAGRYGYRSILIGFNFFSKDVDTQQIDVEPHTEFSECTDLRIIGNYFEEFDSPTGDNGAVNIYTEVATLIDGVIISGNYISNRMTFNRVRNMVISNNSYIGNSNNNDPNTGENACMFFRRCEHVTISGNPRINDEEGVAAIYIDDLGGTQKTFFIHDNDIEAVGDGIYCDDTDEITIHHNRIESVGYGIYCLETVGLTIDHNTITCTTDGIFCQDGSDYVIDTNYVTGGGGNGTTGIYVWAKNADVTNVSVNNNVLTGFDFGTQFNRNTTYVITGKVHIIGNHANDDGGGELTRTVYFTDSGQYITPYPVVMGNSIDDTVTNGAINDNDLVMIVGGSGKGRGAGVMFSGEGTPESAVSAYPGAMYLDRDGGASTTLYIKESGTGNTGWVAK